MEVKGSVHPKCQIFSHVKEQNVTSWREVLGLQIQTLWIYVPTGAANPKRQYLTISGRDSLINYLTPGSYTLLLQLWRFVCFEVFVSEISVTIPPLVHKVF